MSKKRQLLRALGLCVDAMTNKTVVYRTFGRERIAIAWTTGQRSISKTVHTVPGTVHHACRRSKHRASRLPRRSIVRSHAFY